ncbi:phytoene dehydrogenase [Pueribacillus theae]|uniref:Phytoene dehydrogenase n=1 Tax=Pueribacillus theae TaxID=2171751 RepID=A0A2U1JR50_9BACI|nr:FAD-dependent oxidoreductase [Pueribacillus theae]PWA07602.1 phytoene dehydrogenase [Pueribacillus theae]
MANKEVNKEEALLRYDSIVVGGGLAGLTSAAYLTKRGKKILLLERGNLGGRAITLNVRGYKVNYGAHAIYGRDKSILRLFQQDLGLKIDWRDFTPERAKYDIGNGLTVIPANLKGLFNTKKVKGVDKLKFTFEVFKTILQAHKGDSNTSIQEWMGKKGITEDVANLMLTLASSNFFTSEPENIPSDVFFTYYRRLYKTKKPVAYIAGGWHSLIEEFSRIIEENGGTIKTMEAVESVIFQDREITGVQTKNGNYQAKDFIFCIPPRELVKVFANNEIVNILDKYVNADPSYVFIYDVALKNRIDVPYTYVYDEKNKIFITDISYYDVECVPKEGQLLQAIGYLSNDEIENKEKLDEKLQMIEQFYDKHFPGWREKLVFPRITKKAVAQEIKWKMNQHPMPYSFDKYQNLFFAGDWCEGDGQLSELSFSSAYHSCYLLLQKEYEKV